MAVLKQNLPRAASGAPVAVAVVAAAGASASVLVASGAVGVAASAVVVVSAAAGLSSVLFLLSFFLMNSWTLVLRFSRAPRAAKVRVRQQQVRSGGGRAAEKLTNARHLDGLFVESVERVLCVWRASGGW